ncbi:hypothetical protein NQ317_014623 [Molorchus minor]|uniref:Carboxylesterase type B domain-containing protein n=1 Tax=Molorchus minor TaxID=1323400 RepID=A0ABQ9J5I4_9CUCU|nr:hypothetical protein NQ317_014623 [Molorchus minor]
MVVSSYLRFLTLSCFIALVFSGDTTDTIVELQYGKIQGRVAQTFLNNTFYAFQEIPYAAPPIGNLRFMPPNPVDQWDGVLETTKNTKICYQYWGSNSLAGEDCLYLNVYTPVVRLFRGAIMESGTVLTSWGYQRYAKQIAYQTGAVVDSSFTENNSSSELLALLQSISAEDLHSITSNKIAVNLRNVCKMICSSSSVF